MVYDNILEIAKKRGMALREVEQKARIGNGCISRWKKHSPQLNKLTAVADVLNVSVNTLIKEKKEKEE